jgi:hypothetical protein
MNIATDTVKAVVFEEQDHLNQAYEVLEGLTAKIAELPVNDRVKKIAREAMSCAGRDVLSRAGECNKLFELLKAHFPE